MTDVSAKPDWAQSRREKDNAERVARGLKPRRRRWPWVLLALIVAGVAAFVILSPQPAPVEEAASVPEATFEPVMQLNPFEVATVTPQTLSRTVKVTGSLAAQRQTQVASQVSGRVVAVLVRPGDRVNEGDVLVQLDTESLRIQLDQQTSTAEATRAQLQLADSQLARTRDLIERGLTASSGLEQAQSSADALRANLAALELQVEAAEIALRNATLRAPMSGVVSERSVQPGQTVQAGSPLLTVVDLSTLEFEAAAPLSVSALVEPGQTVSVTVEGLSGRDYAGTVSRLNPVAATGTRTIPVYIQLENEDGRLRGGMFAVGNIMVEERADALALPADALREDAQGTFILKRDGDHVVRQPVEAGQSWNNGRTVEIVSGLSTGEEVVIAPLTQLHPGDRVEMVEG